MFEQCPKFEGDMIGNWNTSQVTNMKSLVRLFMGHVDKNGSQIIQCHANIFASRITKQFDRSGFQGDISKWNTANVQDMSHMVGQ